jgi:hypothetical protein
VNEIRDILVSALEDVKAAEVPAELEEVAFAKAIELRSGTVRRTDVGASVSQEASRRDMSDDSDALDRIAGRLGMPRSEIEDIYNEDANGDIEIIVGAGKLSDSSSAATREIALLLCVGRQGSGKEDWTPADAIRKACDDYRKLDSPNFSSTIKGMEDVFTFRGSTRKRELRVARPGWERATGLAKRLIGTE